MSREVRKELKIIPAKVSVVEYVSYVYACRSCEKNNTETTVITAGAPKALVPKSLVSPNVMAYIMNQKFVNAMPLYRQEQELKRMGALLSRQDACEPAPEIRRSVDSASGEKEYAGGERI
jgi:transposase